MTPAVRKAVREQLERFRKDPVLFIHRVFGAEPTKQQVPILMDFAQPGAKVAVKAGHGVGKSSLMSWAGIWLVFLFTETKVAATAPSATQLKDVLMAEISKWVNRAHPWVKGQLVPGAMRLHVRDAEQTQFLTARTARPDKPDALQGLHADNMGFLIDEAFGVADPVYAVARGALTTQGARGLLCGNPTATSGYAFNCFHKNKHIWKCHTLSCIDSPLVSKEYVQEMKDEYGEDSDIYKVRVLGQFPNAAINQLISRMLAESAAKRKYGRHDYIYAPKVLGVDVAWEGDDRSAVYMRQGLHATKLGSWYNIDNVTLANLVHQWWTEHNIDAVFIDVGWGSGVIDILRRLGRDPIPVNFGGSSNSSEYHNKRTEMWCELRKWLEMGGSIDNDEDLIEDLIGPQVAFMPNGKKLLEKKKEMKRRGLKSPDLADALVLTHAAPVIKKTEAQKAVEEAGGRIITNLCSTEYDLFS